MAGQHMSSLQRCYLQVFNSSKPWMRTLTSVTQKSQQGQVHARDVLHHDEPSDDVAILPYARARLGSYVHPEPRLGNQYSEDVVLKSYLSRVMPKHVLSSIEADLASFGERVCTDLYDLHLACEREQPVLQQYNSWGRRVDQLITCDAWKRMHGIVAEEGIVAIAYERAYEEWSRVYQMAKLYLYSPSSGLYTCPVAMTDGACTIIESLGKPALLQPAYAELTSRDPAKFITSGQWMTERKGGSDVAGGTETLAVEQNDGTYRLYGYKWFCSATDASIAFTLARHLHKDGSVVQGNAGLSMFFLNVRDSDGELNNIEIIKLKDKLGTRQLPTSELLLDGTFAYKVSEEGRGVATITDMLTLTRIHNAVASAAAMRRMVNFSRDYATRREAFGKALKDMPLHVQTIARMELEARAATLFVMEPVRLLGLSENNNASENDKAMLRLLTPLIKLYTGKQVMPVMSEALECFGGLGYMEESGLSIAYRDAQVLAIWEGTTNVLSLDVLRAIHKSRGTILKEYVAVVNAKVQSAGNNPALAESCEKVTKAAVDVVNFAQENSAMLELAARDFAFSLSRTYIGALLLEHAGWDSATPQDVTAAQRWCCQSMTPVLDGRSAYTPGVSSDDFALVYDGYHDPQRL